MKTRINQIISKTTATACALFAALAFLIVPGAFAQIAVDTWVGNTSANLNGLNWTGTNNPPANGDNWVFGPAGTAGAVLNNTFAGGITVSNIGFLSTASAYTFANSANPIILTGSITNASTNLQVFNGPISNALTTTIALTTNGGNITIGGMMNSANSLIVTGSGTLSFTNTNYFTGNITNGANSILSVSGPQAALGGNTTYIATTFTTNTNTLVITTNTTTNTDFTTFTYAGFIANSGQLIFNNTFGLTNTGAISGGGAVIANGPGALTLNTTNSWTGPFTINGGTVYDPNVEAAGSAPQSGLGNATSTGRLITVNGPGALVLNAPGGNEFGYGGVTPAITFIANTNGTISVTSGNAQVGALRLNGGAFIIAADTGPQYETCFSSITVGGFLPSAISNATGFSGPRSGINLTINGAANAQMPLNVSNTGTGGPDLLISLVLVNANGSQNSTGFNLNGGGTVQLTASNIFTGPITISPSNTLIVSGNGLLGGGSYGGTLVNNNKFIYSSSSSQVFSGSVFNNGSMVLSSAGNLYFSGSLAGTGTVTNNGPGTTYFFCAAPASTVVNGGQVVVFSTQPSTAPVSVNDGSTLGVIATPGVAHGFSPATLNIGSASGASIAVTISSTSQAPLTAGSLNLVGTTAITVSAGAALTVGQNYPVLSYTSLTGALAAGNFGLPAGVTGTYSSATSAGVTTWSLHVTAVPSSSSVKWTGVQNSGGFGVWDVNTTANWLSGALAANFLDGEAVLFDDTASSFTVGGVGPVSPSAVTFNNSANNYFVSNVVIAGATGITLNGSGFVTNATLDLYSGGTAINNGTLVTGTNSVGLAGPLGILYAPLSLGNSATAGLILKSNSVQVGSISGGGANGGNIALGGGALTVGADGTSQTFDGVISGPGNFTMVGTGSLTLTAVSSISNTLTIGGGNILTLSNNAAIGVNNSGGNFTYPSGIVDNGWIVYGSANNLTTSAAISGNGGIILNGPGSLTLTANSSSFTNNIVINGGTLNDNTGQTGNTCGVGAINVPGRTITVNSGGILSLNNGGGNDFSGGGGPEQIILVINSNGLVQNNTANGNIYVTNIVLAGGTIAANAAPGNTWPCFDLGGGVIVSNLPSTMMAPAVGTPGNGQGFSLGAGGGSGTGSGGQNYGSGYQTWFIVSPTTGGSPAGNADLTVSASLYNEDNGVAVPTGLRLSGGGTMALTVASYFMGPITVSNATLILGGAGQLGNTSGSGTYAGNIALTTTNSAFVFSSSAAQTLTGVISGVGSLVVSNPPNSGLTLLSNANTYTGPTVIKAGTLFLSGTASIVPSSSVVISNGAVLDVTQVNTNFTTGSAQTVMGFGNVNGNFTSTASSILQGGVSNAFGTLTFNNNLTLGSASGFRFTLSTSATGQNSQVLVTGTLACSGAQMHIAAPSGQNLDTHNYTLITASSLAGATFSPAVAWDVAPANQNHYYVTNINNSVVLAYSAIPLPTPGGVTTPTFVLRNQTPLLVVTVVPGNGTVTNVTVDASTVGGTNKLAMTANGVANQWTNSVAIAASLPAGAYLLPATAIDTIPVTGYGAVSVFVVTSTETWAGGGGNGNFGTALNWAIESGQTAPYAPGYVGDSLVFAGTAGLNPVMDTNYTINTLLFTNGAGSFSIADTGTNVLTLVSGTITNFAANVETLNMPITVGSAPTFTSTAGNLVLNGGLSDGGAGYGLTINGPLTGTGTVTLAGTNTLPGVTVVNSGTLNLTSTAILASNGLHTLVGGTATASSNAVLQTAGTFATGQLWVGNISNGVAAVYQTGGNITLTSTGVEVLDVGNVGGSYGYYNAAGGTLTTYGVAVGGEGNATLNGTLEGSGIMDITGGNITNTGWVIMNRGTGTQTGVAAILNLYSGSLTYGVGGSVVNWGTGQTAILNIMGGALSLYNGVQLGINLNDSGNSANTGILNLLGGVTQASAVTGTGGLLNFNGGTLAPSQTAANFINTGSATVYAGGGTISNNGNTITISQPLLAAAGSGLSAIPTFTGGAGYIAPPIVLLSGGGGTGATAIARINPATGVVTNILITCPGVNYTSSPTFTFSGGGGTTKASATNATIAPNTSGPMIFTGTGQVILTGVNTYTGPTVVQSGTLQLSGAGSLNNTSVFWVSNGATLDGSQIGGLFLGNNQAIKGGGAIQGGVTAGFGSQIYPGADPAIDKLTFNSGLNMAFGSIATFNLSTSGTGNNDQVIISGNQSVLSFANNTIHIKAPSTSANLDTTIPYALFQNNSALNVGGLPNPTPVWDVAPANKNTGFWLIQPNGNGIVLKNSSVAPPTGTGSITSGTTSGTNVIRNTTIGVSVNIAPSGSRTIQSVTVDLSAYGGTVANFTQGSGNNWTGTVLIAPGLPPGAFTITVLAYDGTLYGEVNLPVNVLATVDTWSGADFVSQPVSDDGLNWVGGVAPAYLGDSVIFAGTTGLAPIFDQTYSFNGIGFASNAGPFVLSTFNSVSVVGGITNNSTNNEAIMFPITLTGTGTYFASTAGNLGLSNTVSGSGVLNVAGAGGSVTLGGTAAYTGNTVIATNATLILGTNAQFLDAANNASYAGNMTDNGTYVFDSTISQTNAGIISGGGGLIVNGPGTLILRNNGNSFTNNIVINGGIVSDVVGQTGNTCGLGAINVVGRSITVSNGGLLSLDNGGGNDFSGGTGSSQIVLVIGQGGLVKNTSGNVYVTNIVLTGGTISANATLTAQWPSFDLGGSIIVSNLPSTMSASQVGAAGDGFGYSLGAGSAVGYQTPFVVNPTVGGSLAVPPNPDLIVSASLYNTDSSPGNNTGISMRGAGIMALTGTNWFAGPITVTNGTVILGATGLLSNGVYAGNIAISNGATFAFENLQPQVYTGVISGAGTLLVSNLSSPAMSLSTTNTLTGRVVISGGTLSLAAGGSFNNASGVSIAGGATFDVSGLASPYVWPATGSVIASGTAANPATVNSPGAVSLSSGNAVVLTYDDINAAPQPALNVNGNLSLGGNAFTVNTTDGLPLAKGTYVLIQASGSVTSSGTYPAVTGTAIGTGLAGAISVNGSQVLLTIDNASTINTNPSPIQFIRNGNVLTLSWPTNSGWTLESNSINVALTNDWFRITGTSAVTNFPIDLTAVKTNVFYRLVYP